MHWKFGKKLFHRIEITATCGLTISRKVRFELRTKRALIWTAIAGRNDNDYWWVLLLAGIVGVGVGAVTFAAPGLTAVALLVYIAVWALVKGVLEIATAIRLRKEIQGEWLLVVGGAASVAFGALLLARPGAGVLAVLWLIAAYAVVFGVLLVLLAFRARRFVKEVAALGS